MQLSTTSLAKTKNHFVPVLIQFTEPVFGFASSGVIVSGGTLIRQVHEKDLDCFYWHLDYTVEKLYDCYIKYCIQYYILTWYLISLWLLF